MQKNVEGGNETMSERISERYRQMIELPEEGFAVCQRADKSIFYLCLDPKCAKEVFATLTIHEMQSHVLKHDIEYVNEDDGQPDEQKEWQDLEGEDLPVE